MNKKVKVGIVGCGVIGPVHIESYARLPHAEVVAVCDKNAERLSRVAAKYGISKRYADFAGMLSDAEVEAISICTDHYTHRSLVADALAAGKHVLCEKPLGISREDLNIILKASQSSPTLVTAGVLQHRFDALYRAMRSWVSAGVFGKIVTANLQVQCFRSADYYRSDAWRGKWAQEGGSLMINQAIHFVDSLQWIMGGISSLCASHANHAHKDVIETEDTAAAVIKFRNGALGTLTATTASLLPWEPTLNIYGTDGFIETCNSKLVRLQLRDQAKANALLAELAATEESVRTQAGKSDYGASHPTQIRDFVDAIVSKRKPYVTFEDASEPVEIITALYRSEKEGKWIDLR